MGHWSKKKVTKVSMAVVKRGADKMTEKVKAADVGQLHGQLYGPAGKEHRARWFRYPTINRIDQIYIKDIEWMVQQLSAGYKDRPDEVYASELGDTYAEATLGEGKKESDPAEESAAEGDRE